MLCNLGAGSATSRLSTVRPSRCTGCTSVACAGSPSAAARSGRTSGAGARSPSGGPAAAAGEGDDDGDGDDDDDDDDDGPAPGCRVSSSFCWAARISSHPPSPCNASPASRLKACRSAAAMSGAASSQRDCASICATVARWPISASTTIDSARVVSRSVRTLASRSASKVLPISHAAPSRPGSSNDSTSSSRREWMVIGMWALRCCLQALARDAPATRP